MAKAGKTFEDLGTRYTKAVVEQEARAKEALRVYRPTDKQLPFHLSRAPEKILRGGKRAGKTIAVDSGEGTWRSFLEHDLWDGLDMLVHPLAVGSGTPLLASMTAKVPLRLVESKAYENGVVNLRYERI